MLYSGQYESVGLMIESIGVIDGLKILFISMASSLTERISAAATCSGECQATRKTLLSQMVTLKDKAHQSFMQVLQIQQLHDQELQQLHEMYGQKEEESSKQIEGLREEVRGLKQQLEQKQAQIGKNNEAKRVNNCVLDLDKVTQNIDAISLEHVSPLDESEVLQFEDILSIQPTQMTQHMNAIQCLRSTVAELRKQVTRLKTENGKLQQELNQTHNSAKTHQHSLESLNKEVQFMSQQLRRLGSDKLKLEKKVNELERSKLTDNSKGESKATTLSSSQGMASMEPIKKPEKVGLIRRNSSNDGLRNNPQEQTNEVNVLSYAQLIEGGQAVGDLIRRKSTSSSWRGRLGLA